MLPLGVFYGGLVLLVIGAILPFALLRRRGAWVRAASLSSIILGAAFLLSFAVCVLFDSTAVDLGYFAQSPSFSLSFSLDRLSAFFVVLISLVSVCVGIYSIGYIEHDDHEARKNALVGLMAVFILSMTLTVCSSNTLSFLFFWELMSLSSFFLVVYDYDKPEGQKAGVFYFVMTQLGAVFLFMGFILLFILNGSFAMSINAPLTRASLNLLFAFFFLGFSMKAGIIPFHKWLPYAHPASPSNISALMSGVMLKVALYGLIRFMLLSPPLSGIFWGSILLLSGTASAILGILYALKEHDIKRFLAYSSIENIGIIYIGLGLSVIFRAHSLGALADVCLVAALFHTFNHALFKSLLFMSAGSIVNAAGTRDIETMGGLIRRMPYTSVFFLVGAASISALPPLNGFASEFLIFQALMQSYHVAGPMLQVMLLLCLSILALTSAFAAACFVKAFGLIFLALPRSAGAKNASESGTPVLAGQAILAISCIVMGVFSKEALLLAGYLAPMPDLMPVGILLIVTFVAILSMMLLTSSSKTRITQTWGCGILSQNGGMEYTASGFSEPIMRIFRPIYRTQEDGERMFFDKFGSIFKEGHAEIHLMKFFEDYVYLPVAHVVEAISKEVSRLQNGHLDSYISYAFITVVVLLAIIGWFL
jgi:formate hydrogenlyase subunit 3/multisubunit Na+/H+ antiporter MnhD subunit